MGSVNITSGLTLAFPTQGTNPSYALQLAMAQAISAHDHTGSGKGLNIGTNAIAAGAVTEAKLASAAVTAAKIASDAVTTAKILDANVTAAKLASDAVTTAKILDANVTAAKLANGAVGTTELADEGVTTAKLSVGARPGMSYSLGGSSNAYTVTFSPAITDWAQIQGLPFRAVPNHSNTSAATLNANALGAKTILRRGGAALVGNELIQNTTYTFIYDGTNVVLMDWIIPTPIGTFAYYDSAAIGAAGNVTADMGHGIYATGVPTLIHIPFDVRLVALSLRFGASVSSGAATATVFKNGSTTGQSITKGSGTPGAVAYTTPTLFSAGDTLGIQLTTSSISTTAKYVHVIPWVV